MHRGRWARGRRDASGARGCDASTSARCARSRTRATTSPGPCSRPTSGSARTVADRVLFITSNGTGLGPPDPSMAIARRLEPGLEPLILTLSGAAPVVAEQGFEVEYVSSYANPTAGSDWRWSRRLRARLRAVLREADAKVMVFDGAHPYQALIDAMPAAPEMHRVWCRRPMWTPGLQPRRDRARGLLRPRARARRVRGSEDRGADRRPARSRAPRRSDRLLRRRASCSPREQAERELGLDPGATNVLGPARPGRGGAGCRRALLCATSPAARTCGWRRSPRRSPALRERPRRRGPSALDLSDEPLPAGVRPLGLGRRLQRLPRADPLRRAEPVRADAPPDRRSGRPRALRAGDRRRARRRRARRARDRGSARRAARPRRASGRAAAARLELRPGNGAAEAAALDRRSRGDRAACASPGTPRWRRYARHPLARERKAARSPPGLPSPRRGSSGRRSSAHPPRRWSSRSGAARASSSAELPGAARARRRRARSGCSWSATMPPTCARCGRPEPAASRSRAASSAQAALSGLRLRARSPPRAWR